MPKDFRTSTTRADRSRVFSRVTAIFVFVVGALVLAGWFSGNEMYMRLFGSITMKANAAIGIMLVATSVWALPRRTQSAYRMLGLVCAIVAALIGLLTLSEHVFGWNLHIDQILFTELPGALATASPGRMGITSSTCFILFGLALVLLYKGRAIATAQLLTLTAGFWALLALIGYSYQAEALFGIAQYTGIAFPTAAALFILSLSILSSCLDEGVIAIVCGDTAAGIMARRLTTIAILVPFILGWLCLAGQRAGKFDLGFGTSLLIAIIILVFVLAIWRAAVKLDYVDQQRKATEIDAEKVRRGAEHSQALLAGIVESSEDAIISKTLDGIIDSWNESAERLFEYTADEAIGKSISLIIPPERLSEEKMIIKRLRQGDRIEHFETVRVSKTGKEIDISLTISPIRNQHGTIIGASKIARNISYRRIAEQERERMLLQERSLRVDAERAARLKDEFLATISHELRTPLNAILGWSAMLSKGSVDEAITRRGIEAIERNAKSQAQLIEDLLDVSRIISGNLRLNVEPVALTSIVKGVMESVQPAADAKGIQMQMVVDPVADNVKGDAARLQQVLWNLLANSIKFTPHGGSVVVKIDRVDSMSQVIVTDTGEGIGGDFLPFVFDRFKQADGTTTRKHGGLGLGLAIARHLMEMHGGTIEAESPGPGLGSSFTVRIPLAGTGTTGPLSVDSIATPHESPAEVGTRDLKGIHILVVDDEADARDMLKTMLERVGADVTIAASAHDAINALTTRTPDVLISDIGMPGEDGFTFIKKVRQLSRAQGGEVPAVALTGYVRVEERMRALTAGYQMFVPKPVEVTELTTVIASLVGV